MKPQSHQSLIRYGCLFTQSVLFSLFCLFLFSIEGLAQQTDLTILTDKFGKSPQQADFIIVVDRSGSMRKFWEPLKSSVADFIDAIPKGDYVSVLYFEADSGELVTPCPITSENIISLKQKILGLGIPTGDYTDLGQGINRTLDELNRPNPNRLQFVFFFTDFVHESPPNSKWRSRDCSSSAWRELEEKKKRLLDNQQHIVKLYALRLPLSRNVGQDIHLFKCVFGDIEQVTVSDNASLQAWFERRKAEILRDKIRIQVENELNKGRVNISLHKAEKFEIGKGKKAKVYCTMTSTYRVLDIIVKPVSGIAEGKEREYEVSSNGKDLQLAPTESKKTMFTVHNFEKDECFFPKLEPLLLALTLNMTHIVLPEKELKILNIEPTRQLSVKTSLNGRLRCGYPLWLIILSSIIIIAAIAFTGKKSWDYFKPVYLYGIVQDDKRPLSGHAVKRNFKRIEHLNEITIGTEESNIMLQGATSDAIIKFLAKRKPKRGIYIQLIEGQATLDGKYLAKNTVEQLRRGKSKIEIAGYTLRWK